MAATDLDVGSRRSVGSGRAHTMFAVYRFCSATATPGMAAPLASDTVPLISPDGVCTPADTPDAQQTITASANSLVTMGLLRVKADGSTRHTGPCATQVAAQRGRRRLQERDARF